MHPRHLVLLLASLAAAVPATAQQAAPDPLGTPNAASEAMMEAASRDRIKGDPDAPVTVFELSDFQCPFCREFVGGAYPALDSAYIQTGQVRLIYLNFPLPSHGQAWPAAEAAMCAGAQQSFWPMHDRLFASQDEWGGSPDAGAHFERYAADLGLDAAAFRDCTAADRMAPLILGDVIQAASSGAGATPTFVIDGGPVLSGAQPFEEFRRAIEAALEKKF